MNKRRKSIWKATLSKVMVVVLVMLTVLILPNSNAKAATVPTLTKTSRNILMGATYDLDVNNKIKNSKYTWTSSNKSIATVDSKGKVKGINKGTAVITCTVKTPTKAYKLTCQVTIIKPATLFTIKNKVTALNLGQQYDIDRTIAPSNSNDKTTWTTSDKTIAIPDTKGAFTALKLGTVTITGKTLSGKSDSMTIKVVDKEGTVTNQEELTALVGSGVKQITIKTDEVADLTIPSGNYTNTKLIVDAPKADIHNNGVFASIEIRQIAANSWYENAVGNLLNILAAESRIVVAPNAVVKLEVNKEAATLKIENNGVVEEVVVVNAADIDITGSSEQSVPVKINARNLSLSTSVPLNLDLSKKIDLTLRKGSEATKIQVVSTEAIPAITGNSKVVVTVGTGNAATTQEIVPTPLPTEPTAGGGFGGGFGGGTGGSSGGGTTPTVTETVNPDGSINYRLSKPYTELSSIQITYQSSTEFIDGGMLATMKLFLADDALAISYWKGITNSTNPFSGQSMKVVGDAGSSMKTVTITGGQYDGKSYQVTVAGNSTVSVTNVTNGTTFTITRLDEYTLRISANHSDITFIPTFY